MKMNSIVSHPAVSNSVIDHLSMKVADVPYAQKEVIKIFICECTGFSKYFT
jgi:hypothetical protein